MKKVLSAFLCTLFLMGTMCGCGGKTQKRKISAMNDQYRNYYEIFVGSFYDSNNDGVGDLPGIIKKLDYLNSGDSKSKDSLGINGIWLMPIMPSPSYHKYDITDYCKIDSKYGTMHDFDELVKQCHKRKIKLIIDLPINHTSNEHPWFVKAAEAIKNNDLSNKYIKYYNFEKSPKETGKYEQLVGTDMYYEAEFSENMPDLNMDNQQVQEQIRSICKFWIDRGVDGFRLDAAKYIYNDKNKNIDFWRGLYSYCKVLKKDVYMVGEVWDSRAEILDYYQSGLNSFFNFPFAGSSGAIAQSVQSGNGEELMKLKKRWQTDIHSKNPAAIDALFLSNHDMARSAGFLGRNLEKEKFAASVYQLMPGNSFIYYGEELGMLGSGNDQTKRFPFVWSNSNNQGETKPFDGADQKPEKILGAQEQIENSNSLFQYYREILNIKNRNPEIARGEMKVLNLKNDKIGAYISEYEGSKVAVFQNFSSKEEKVDFNAKKQGLDSLCEAISPNEKVLPQYQKNELIMPPYSTAVFH